MKSLHSYITGYGLSVALTLAAFGLLYFYREGKLDSFPYELMVPLLILLALAQFFIQLVFFLHLGQEEHPRWNSIAFVFTAFIVIVLVGGTIWIMNSLTHDHGVDLLEIYPTGHITPQAQDD